MACRVSEAQMRKLLCGGRHAPRHLRHGHSIGRRYGAQMRVLKARRELADLVLQTVTITAHFISISLQGLQRWDEQTNDSTTKVSTHLYG